jgi:GTPase SAR1 family protein
MGVLVVAGQPGVGKSYFMREMLLDMSFCKNQPRKYINLMVED